MRRSSSLGVAAALLVLALISTGGSAVSAGSVVGANGSPSDRPPDVGQIVYRAGVGQGTAIVRIDADGTNKVRLTDPRESYVEGPRWSPDGTQIAFSGRRDTSRRPDIWVMNADGTGRNRLTRTPDTFDWMPAWSPDGSQIAWLRQGPQGIQFAIMNADGTNAHALAMPRGSHPWIYCDWSPDGSQIVFTLCGRKGCDLFSVAPDGTGLRQLTDTTQKEWYPRWSPDGSTIVFTLDSEDPQGMWSVWSLDPVTLDVAPMLDDPASYELEAAFSPSGGRLAWVRSPSGSQKSELVTSDLDGSNATVVVPCKRESCYLEDPDWTA